MKCESCETAVLAWTEGMLDDKSLEEFHSHILSCPDCLKKYSDVLPLLERDIGIIRRTSKDFTETVMASLPKSPKRSMWAISASSTIRPYLLVAAAAIFMVGIGLGAFFARFENNTVAVRFILSHPNASSVHLAGTFNRWNDKDYAMKRIGSTNTWEIKIPLEKGKVYVYNFVIDESIWIADPEIPVKTDDGFGGSGSLLRL